MVAQLLEHRDAVAYGLTVMVTDMLFVELPAMLAKLIGEKQATMVLEMLAKKTAEEGFRHFLEKLSVKPGSLTLREVLEVFVLREGSEPAHPFQRVTRIVEEDDRITLVVKNGRESPAILAGVIAGVMEAGLGVRTQALASPATAQHLCHQDNPPDYIVYPAGEDRVVVERLKCGKQD